MIPNRRASTSLRFYALEVQLLLHIGFSIHKPRALSSIAFVKMKKDLVLVKIRWLDSELQGLSCTLFNWGCLCKPMQFPAVGLGLRIGLWVRVGAKLNFDLRWAQHFSRSAFPGRRRGSIRGVGTAQETLAVQMELDSRRLPRLAGGHLENLNL